MAFLQKNFLYDDSVHNFKKGITALELLLSIVLLVSLFSVTMFATRSLWVKNDMDEVETFIVQSLRRAQIMSVSANRDSSWGVYLTDDEIVLYRGNSFATRNSTFDEELSLPGTIELSGLEEVNFEKLTGIPSQTGNITVEVVDTDEQIVISINEKGVVDY